jgi:hypothetical protein
MVFFLSFKKKGFFIFVIEHNFVCFRFCYKTQWLIVLSLVFKMLAPMMMKSSCCFENVIKIFNTKIFGNFWILTLLSWSNTNFARSSLVPSFQTSLLWIIIIIETMGWRAYPLIVFFPIFDKYFCHCSKLIWKKFKSVFKDLTLTTIKRSNKIIQ